METERYKYSVLDVCAWLHGEVSGSGDALTVDEHEALVKWLRHRVGDGWEVGPYTTWLYDSHVRALARACLQEVARRWPVTDRTVVVSPACNVSGKKCGPMPEQRVVMEDPHEYALRLAETRAQNAEQALAQAVNAFCGVLEAEAEERGARWMRDAARERIGEAREEIDGLDPRAVCAEHRERAREASHG